MIEEIKRSEFIQHWKEADAELTRLHRQEDDLMKLRTRWVEYAARLRATNVDGYSVIARAYEDAVRDIDKVLNISEEGNYE